MRSRSRRGINTKKGTIFVTTSRIVEDLAGTIAVTSIQQYHDVVTAAKAVEDCMVSKVNIVTFIIEGY